MNGPDWSKLLPSLPRGPQCLADLLADVPSFAPERVTEWAWTAYLNLCGEYPAREQEALSMHRVPGLGCAVQAAAKLEGERRTRMALAFWRMHGCPHVPDEALYARPKRLRKGQFFMAPHPISSTPAADADAHQSTPPRHPGATRP